MNYSRLPRWMVSRRILSFHFTTHSHHAELSKPPQQFLPKSQRLTTVIESSSISESTLPADHQSLSAGPAVAVRTARRPTVRVGTLGSRLRHITHLQEAVFGHVLLNKTEIGSIWSILWMSAGQFQLC